MSVRKHDFQATLTTLLSTELNSLAAGNIAVGSAFDNAQGTANLDGYLFGTLELVLAAPPSAVVAGSVCAVWFLRSIDGTNFEDGSASVYPVRPPDVLFFPVEGSGAQRLIGVTEADGPQGRTTRVPMPVGDFKALFYAPRLGTALASSGNTLRVRMETTEDV